MELRRTLLAVVLVAGAGLVLYGAWVGDEGTVSVEVTGPIDEAPAEVPHVEYDYLDPEIQDAFRESLETGEDVQVSAPPEEARAIVDYRDANYSLATEWGDAGQTTMFFSIAGGSLLMVLGIVGYYVAGRFGDESATGS